MNFTLIICTYQRPLPLLELLNSVADQKLYPNQILVIDGSVDHETSELLKEKPFVALEYFRVGEKERGLTNQRNFGLQHASTSSEVICFLDDDVVLTHNYFQELLETYKQFPDALGVGGYILDGVPWRKLVGKADKNPNTFNIDGFSRPDSSRFLLRKNLGLMPRSFPTFMPPEGHGRSVGFLPPTGKTYRVETFMGGVASYRAEVFDSLVFSSFFKGYGLYEDTDFTLRLSRLGKLYVNTAAKLCHFHDDSGRPNRMDYGKMVVRNGWYVWRVKYPEPSVAAKMKWHLITLLLIFIRFSNIINTSSRSQALTESLGRFIGWFSLFFKKPLKGRYAKENL